MAFQKSYSITSGAIIMIVMRWADRLIGVVSTSILARILIPDDFGIVAMASVVVAFADVIFDLGINVALIQKKYPSQSFYNTAWTLRILQSCCVATILTVIAPLAAKYYADPRIIAVVQLMALSLLIASFENVGIINFQKELRFSDDAKFVLFKRLVGFGVTIVLVCILRNYWGMIIGTVCGRLVSTCASYVVHPMRPRFSFANISEIFSVSQWVLVKNISRFLDEKMHVFLVGGIVTSGITGGYTLASEIADIPGTDLLAPINRVLFPAFARARDNLAELTNLLLAAQAVQVMVTFPACAGFILIARELVPVALGEKWLFIVPFVQILAFSNIIQSMSSSANYVLTVIGQIRLLALSSWIQISLFGLGVLSFYSDLSPERIAEIRLASIVLTFGVSYALLMRYIPGLTVAKLVRGTGRPALACLIMALSLFVLESEVHAPQWVVLILKATIGAVVYCVTVLLLWFFAGCPKGAEVYFLSKFKRAIPPIFTASSEIK